MGNSQNVSSKTDGYFTPVTGLPPLCFSVAFLKENINNGTWKALGRPS
jgi:hypothetical protein